MLHHDDVVYQILLWLPVVSLLRFKLVCRTWRALIESNDFIRQHVHCHHYDPSLKYKNNSLIYLVTGNGSPITFPLVSVDSFEEPNACVQLDCSDLREYSPLTVPGIVSYNGIVCLNLLTCKGTQIICLWNPATKQSRLLPQSPTFTTETQYDLLLTMVGFGFDVDNNDYKVVNRCQNIDLNEERVEVYSLNTDSWRTVATGLPFRGWLENPRMPFNNGTSFFWYALNSEGVMILCFDFSSENFRSMSFRNANYHALDRYYSSVVSDKIACVSIGFDCQTDIWMFNEYGSVNESWIKLYKIDPCSTINWTTTVKWLSMDGKYLFFGAMGQIVRYNVVTKDIKSLPTVGKCEEVFKDRTSSRPSIYFLTTLVEFKESLLSVGKGNMSGKKNDN